MHPYPDTVPPDVYLTLSNAIFLRRIDSAKLAQAGWHIAGYLLSQYLPTGPQAMAPAEPLTDDEMKELLERQPATPTYNELVAMRVLVERTS